LVWTAEAYSYLMFKLSYVKKRLHYDNWYSKESYGSGMTLEKKLRNWTVPFRKDDKVSGGENPRVHNTFLQL